MDSHKLLRTDCWTDWLIEGGGDRGKGGDIVGWVNNKMSPNGRVNTSCGNASNSKDFVITIQIDDQRNGRVRTIPKHMSTLMRACDPNPNTSMYNQSLL